MRLMTTNPSARLAMWMHETGRNTVTAASELNVDRTMVSLMLREKRAPGLALAVAIETLTSAWAKGPIRAAEWVGLAERLSQRSRAAA